MFGEEEARVSDEEADVGELVLEPSEESGERLLVPREVLVPGPIVVVYSANLAELEFALFLLLLLLQIGRAHV